MRSIRDTQRDLGPRRRFVISGGAAMPRLPSAGDWMLRRAENMFSSDASPFDFLRANFETMTGGIRKMQNTASLNTIHRLGETGFWRDASSNSKAAASKSIRSRLMEASSSASR
jgi:hypothetical protein